MKRQPNEKDNISTDLIDLANHQAKLAVRGNGAAKKVAQKCMVMLTKYQLL
jgi:hypothetical protein